MGLQGKNDKLQKLHKLYNIQWSERLNSSAYQKGKTIIEHLRIVNDSAERGVKLVEDYNTVLREMKLKNNFYYK